MEENRPYKGIDADLFSAGVVFYTMFAGKFPFGRAVVTDTNYRIVKQNQYDLFWKTIAKKTPNLPEVFQKLMWRVFQNNPSNRPTLNELLENEWINDSLPTEEKVKEYLQGSYEKILQRKDKRREIE